MQDFLMLLGLLAALWLWRDSTRSREQAIGLARRACLEIEAQFLDETVAISKIRLCRTNRGTMALCRRYRFDFTLDGEQRREGLITMQGHSILDVVLDIDRSTDLH